MVDRQSLMNVEIGSKMGECAQTAIQLLSGKKSGSADVEAGRQSGKYRFASLLQRCHSSFPSFKWGNQPTMELLLASYGGSPNTAVIFCFAAWIFVIFFTLIPLAFV